MSRRASLLIALVVLAFTLGAAMHAAASVEMSFKMTSTATESGAPPCDDCGGGDASTDLCPDVCVASAMPAVLFAAMTVPVALSTEHHARPAAYLAGQAGSPELHPPRLT